MSYYKVINATLETCPIGTVVIYSVSKRGIGAGVVIKHTKTSFVILRNCSGFGIDRKVFEKCCIAHPKSVCIDELKVNLANYNEINKTDIELRFG